MARPKRCNECYNCKDIERARAHFTPNPPFSHASDEMSRMWNETLAENPCATWDPETVSKYRLEFDKLTEPIRPRCGSCEEGPGYFNTPYPGILAHLESGSLEPDAAVERCDRCKRYATDVDALQALRKILGTTNGVAT